MVPHCHVFCNPTWGPRAATGSPGRLEATELSFMSFAADPLYISRKFSPVCLYANAVLMKGTFQPYKVSQPEKDYYPDPLDSLSRLVT